MLDTKKLQTEIHEWAEKNFDVSPSWKPYVGMVEEMSEMTIALGQIGHHLLKSEQGIRGTTEQHKAGIIDAVGDLCVYLFNFCEIVGIDVEDAVNTTWDTVKKRDWKKFPGNGVNK